MTSCPVAQDVIGRIVVTVEFVASAPWRAPVFVRIRHGSTEPVENTAEAIHYLKHRWPHERGRHYARAMKDCAAATERLLPAEVAKEPFVAAAIEARLLA